jgi:hypothetical protein
MPTALFERAISSCSRVHDDRARDRPRPIGSKASPSSAATVIATCAIVGARPNNRSTDDRAAAVRSTFSPTRNTGDAPWRQWTPDPRICLRDQTRFSTRRRHIVVGKQNDRTGGDG